MKNFVQYVWYYQLPISTLIALRINLLNACKARKFFFRNLIQQITLTFQIYRLQSKLLRNVYKSCQMLILQISFFSSGSNITNLLVLYCNPRLFITCSEIVVSVSWDRFWLKNSCQILDPSELLQFTILKLS